MISDPLKNSVKTGGSGIEDSLRELKHQLRGDRYGFRDVHFAGVIARDVLENPKATRDTQRYAKRCARQLGTSVGEIERIIQVIESYGIRVAKRKRSRGTRLQQELGTFTGVIPRALALRTPIQTSTRIPVDTPNWKKDQKDRYGPVVCSKSLRDTHLGVLAAVCGLWDARKTHKDQGYVDLTFGELAFLVRSGNRADKRVSGKDLVAVRDALHDWADLDIQATLNDENGNPNYEIPSTPITRVGRYIGGQWVSQKQYERRVESGESPHGQKKTVRVWLAGWVLEQLKGTWGQDDEENWKLQRNTVFISFQVWRGLNATARRLYMWLQGSTLYGSGGQKHVEFYLYDFVKYTLGVRCDHAPELIRRALDQLSYVDRRYHPTAGTSPGWTRSFVEGRQFNTSFVRFKVFCWWRFTSKVVDQVAGHARRTVKTRLTELVKRTLNHATHQDTPAVEESFIKEYAVGIPPP